MRSFIYQPGIKMNKIMLICSLVLFISGYVMAAEPASSNLTDIEAASGIVDPADEQKLAATDFLSEITPVNTTIILTAINRFHQKASDY
jgi:hypothetical protein